MGIIKEISVSKKVDPYFLSVKMELCHYDNLDDELAGLKKIVDEKIHEWIVGPRESEPAPQERKEGDFNLELRTWIRCPICGNKEIDFTNFEGKSYQACTICKIFLNDNGTTAPKGTRGRGVLDE